MQRETNRPDAPPSDLEQVAGRIADEQPVNWRDVGDESDAASLSGLREIEQLAQGFRHLQVSAIAPKTPASNKFRFGNLQVLEPLGTGTQGEVWRAYDPLLDLQVALKLRKVDSDTLSHQFLRKRAASRACARPTSSAFTAPLCMTAAPDYGPNSCAARLWQICSPRMVRSRRTKCAASAWTCAMRWQRCIATASCTATSRPKTSCARFPAASC